MRKTLRFSVSQIPRFPDSQIPRFPDPQISSISEYNPSMLKPILAVTAVVGIGLTAVQAQQPPAPARDTLPDNPGIFDSSTRGPSGSPIPGPRFRVVALKGLQRPYGLAFLPD